MNSFVDNIQIIIALIIAMIHLRLSKINDVYSIRVYYRQHNSLILTSLLNTLGYHTMRYVDTIVQMDLSVGHTRTQLGIGGLRV